MILQFLIKNSETGRFTMLNIVIALPRRSLGITGNFGLGLVKASNCALKFAKCVAKSAISDFLFMRLIPAKCALLRMAVYTVLLD